MTKATVAVFVLGLGLVIGGGYFIKLVNVEAGVAIVGVGTWIMGWLKERPEFAKKGE